MDFDLMNRRFKMIFTEEQISRIKLVMRNDWARKTIVVDVHGLTCKEAERFINNIINVTRASCIVEVIHGYRHGVSIKNMLSKTFKNPRVLLKVTEGANLGVTYLVTEGVFCVA